MVAQRIQKPPKIRLNLETRCWKLEEKERERGKAGII